MQTGAKKRPGPLTFSHAFLKLIFDACFFLALFISLHISFSLFRLVNLIDKFQAFEVDISASERSISFTSLN